MNIYEKVRRARKHYKVNPERIKKMLQVEIEKSDNPVVFWASLIFDADIKRATLGERRAIKTATNHNITCFTIKGEAIFPC